MTRGEFRNIRLGLDLTQAALAKKLGVKVETVNRWETGRLKLPKIAALAIRQVASDLGAPAKRGRG